MLFLVICGELELRVLARIGSAISVEPQSGECCSGWFVSHHQHGSPPTLQSRTAAEPSHLEDAVLGAKDLDGHGVKAKVANQSQHDVASLATNPGAPRHASGSDRKLHNGNSTCALPARASADKLFSQWGDKRRHHNNKHD